MGAENCRKIAFAAVVSLVAATKNTSTPAYETAQARARASGRGKGRPPRRRTTRAMVRAATRLRAKAICSAPRGSTLMNSPLELQSRAASATRAAPRMLSPCPVMEPLEHGRIFVSFAGAPGFPKRKAGSAHGPQDAPPAREADAAFDAEEGPALGARAGGGSVLLPGAAGQPVAGAQVGRAVLQGAGEDQGQFGAAMAVQGHAHPAGHAGQVQGGASGGIPQELGHVGAAQAATGPAPVVLRRQVGPEQAEGIPAGRARGGNGLARGVLASAAVAVAQVHPQQQGLEGITAGFQRRPGLVLGVVHGAPGDPALTQGGEGAAQGALRGRGGRLGPELPQQVRGALEAVQEGPARRAETQVQLEAEPAEGPQGALLVVGEQIDDFGAGGHEQRHRSSTGRGANSGSRARRASRARCTRWRTSSRVMPRWRLISSVSQPSRSRRTKTARWSSDSRSRPIRTLAFSSSCSTFIRASASSLHSRSRSTSL